MGPLGLTCQDPDPVRQVITWSVLTLTNYNLGSTLSRCLSATLKNKEAFQTQKIQTDTERMMEEVSTGTGPVVPAVAKREAPPAVAHPAEESEGVSAELDKDLLCPICMQTIKDAFLTACGHSFCYMCIATHLRHKSDCPCCAHHLTLNHLFPNFLLDKVQFLRNFQFSFPFLLLTWLKFSVSYQPHFYLRWWQFHMLLEYWLQWFFLFFLFWLSIDSGEREG